MGSIIQQLFQDNASDYCASRPLCVREHRALQSFCACRTARLGGHVETCPEGHYRRVHYNSCKHRSCPQCNGLLNERWFQKQKAKLLACPHHHFIFTIPHELISLWLFNRSLFMSLLFRAVHEALLTLLKDPRYLGATPGILMAFHGWGRGLNLHPHIHCLVTDGGLEDGEWVRPSRSHFLPLKPLMLIFQGVLAKHLHRGLDKGSLSLPTGTDVPWWHARLKRLKSKAWNVRLQERYDHGEGVAHYLARYVRGGPIHPSQVQLSGNKVLFRYYDYKDNPGGVKEKSTTLTFTPAQLITKLLQLVPAKRSQVIRSYGLYAHTKTKSLNIARQLHHQTPVKETPFIDWQSYLQQVTQQDYLHCPKCKRLLVSTEVIPRQQYPPQKAYVREAA